MTETRFSELRLAGTRISGVLMAYGSYSPACNETFAARSLKCPEDGRLPISLQHSDMQLGIGGA